ncbi:muts domain V-domain-containing protein [Tuber indicum]|nr:muts domain V-domain-containing protein [Tuber indicum]
MGKSKNPGNAPVKAPQGKQRMISSFFAPKQSPGKTSTDNSPATPTIKKTKPDEEKENKTADQEENEREPDSPPRTRRRVTQKRVLEDAEDVEQATDDDDYYSKPGTTSIAKKKLKRSPEPVANLESGEEKNEETRKKEANFLAPAAASRTKKAADSGRTLKYLYNPFEDAMDMDGEPVDSATKKRREKLHEKFVQKLGKPGSVPEAHGVEVEEEAAEQDPEEPDDDGPGPIAKRFGGSAKGKAPPKGGKKLTPLERQVVEIKRKNPDTLLVVEVGYKFRFFGEDARTASQVLSIMCIPGKMRFDEHSSESHLDKFASASIPTHRLHVHVKRLVTAGHKVGVVRQVETAALKAAGDNRNAPFERKLTNLYTKGTYIDDVDGLDGDLAAGAGSGGAAGTGFMLCIAEKPGGGTGTDEKAHVGIVAVQPATGDVIYDEFDDGFMRSEIETRLLHIAPCEFLIVGELTKATEKLVSHLAGSTTTVLGDQIRIERVEGKKDAKILAPSHVSKFYADKLKSADSPEAAESNRLLEIVMNLPDLVTTCLSALITHLSSYGLEHIFDLTKYFKSFSARSHMLLNGNTLSSLEIYRNQTDFSTKGSLFWTLDRTKTKFGKRQLRKWVGRPLLDKERLEERIEAVEEIKGGKSPKLERLRELLSKISYDLEKGLIRIYYGKCSRPELLSILQTLNRIANTFPPVDKPEDVGFNSKILNEALANLPRIKDDVEAYLDVFNHSQAAKDDKYDFFKDGDNYEAINEHKMGIAGVEGDLNEHLNEIAAVLKRKVVYVSVSGVEYLVEVSNEKNILKSVPATWVKMNGTRKVSRFHTPEVIKLLRERDQHKESLAAECNRAFAKFLADISTKYQEFRDCVQSLATLDCLISLAAVANQPGYVKPEFTEEPCIEVREGRHPMVEQLLLDAYVPNDIHLFSDKQRAMIVTGPNMGGKSSFVRQVALIAIMAQVGSYVPASAARVGMLDAVFTRMGAFDNMMAGESTFMVELNETSDILKQATNRSLVILDELGRGTSTHDGVAIANAVLDYVITELKSMCLFVTHYPLLAQFGERYPENAMNAHMKFEEANDGTENITFLYQIGEGVAHRSYGLNVARLAGLPQRCIEVAGVKSSQLEKELKERQTTKWAKTILSATEKEEADFDPLQLLASIENL